MATPLRFRKLTRRNPCSVYRCKNRDTYLIHRGQDVNHNTLYLCEECIKDIVKCYIDTVGADHAKETFADSIHVLMPHDSGEMPSDANVEDSDADEVGTAHIPYQTDYKLAKSAAMANKSAGRNRRKPEDTV